MPEGMEGNQREGSSEDKGRAGDWIRGREREIDVSTLVRIYKEPTPACVFAAVKIGLKSTELKTQS